MTPLTILQFLVGSRSAIERIAACRLAPWLGLIFVFSAALAREYDGQDLMHEPWHLLLPLAASLGTSFLLYLLLRTVGWFRGAGWKPFFAGYWSFLGLYWMTAPLAWLYGIPVERFLDEYSATSANLWMLAIVATWRVLLMTRVASVLWSAPFFAVLFPVMLMADTVAILLARLTPLPEPLFVTMSGTRYASASAAMIMGTVAQVMVLGSCTWLVWLIGTLWVATRREGRWNWSNGPSSAGNGIASSLWILASFSVVCWVPALYYTQPEQQLSKRVDQLLRSNQIVEAMSVMSAHSKQDFPPLWEPPPRITYGEDHPDIVDIAAMLAESETTPWVRQLFLEKFKLHLETEDDRFGIWSSLELPELDRHLKTVEGLPEREQLLASNYQGLIEVIAPKEISTEFRERVLKALGEKAAEARGEIERRNRTSEFVHPADP
jgi:hypothetical protein